MSEEPAVFSFDQHLGRHAGPMRPPEKALTLRDFYESQILPEIGHQAPNSLQSDRQALNHWERYVGNPDIRIVRKDHLVMLRDKMTEAGRSPATINKTWREIKAMLQEAVERDVIRKMPRIGIGMKSKLIRESPKRQRELITLDEMTRLWHACEFATYPNPSSYRTADIWRSLLLFFWMYGPRTSDLMGLRWESIYWKSRKIRFEAMKTRKLQALPLTDLTIAYLRSLEGLHPELVFGGLPTKGKYLREPDVWRRGYLVTWRTEILPAAGIEEPLQFKHFRETMVSNLNALEPQLGSWVAGHFIPGVSAQSYDLPTMRIRRAIEQIEVPEVFRENIPAPFGDRRNKRRVPGKRSHHRPKPRKRR